MVVAMSAAAPPRLAAQSMVGAPTVAASQGGKQLDFRASFNGGYDGNDTETSASAIGLDPLFFRASSHFGGDFQLQFSVPGRRVGFGAGWASAVRSYRAADTVLVSHNAAAGMTAGLTPHMTLRASVHGSFSPPYQLQLFPGIGQAAIGQATALPLDGSLATSHLVAYGTSTGLTYNVTKRSSLTLGHDLRDVRFGDLTFAARAHDANGAYHVGLMKSLGLRLGYRYQLYKFADPTTGSRSSFHADNVDIGLDYGMGHGLKLSRRTTATFGFGIGTYTDARTDARPDRLKIRVIGDAGLSQQLFRTWSLALGYSRGLNFIDGFGVPIFSDSVSARLAGQFTRRVGAYARASYSIDRFGAVSPSGQYRSHRSVAGIRVNLTQKLDGYVQYVNYHRAFPDTALLLQGALPMLNRQGINGGLTFTLPLIGRQRAVPRGPS